VKKLEDYIEYPGNKEVVLYVGGVHASAEPVVIRTLLGSCIAVCLFDPVQRVGGMNHFMLPNGAASITAEAARFGVHAMELLLCGVMKAGGDRRRLVAKVFGGAHVLDISEKADSVPRQNIAFIHTFLPTEGIPLAAEDVGGYHPRVVHFQTHTGQAFVRTVKKEQARHRLLEREARERTTPPRYGSVTLFEDS
jgi:chemotaxis receptor (MCP) glutamine deamidase CheD